MNCWSEQLEKPGKLFDSFPFPEQNAHFLVQVAGEDQPTKFADKTQWGKAQNQPNVGTAWLVAVDSSSAMGSRFGDARAIAHELIEEMQPNDLLDLMFFDDVQVVNDTKWKTYKQRADLGNALNAFKATSPSHGRDRALFSQIKTMTQDAFGSLGNSDQPDTVPLHQSMVVLSNGAGTGRPGEREPQRRRLPPVPRPGPLPRRQHVAAEDAAARHLDLAAEPLEPDREHLPQQRSTVHAVARQPRDRRVLRHRPGRPGRGQGQDDHRARARALQRDVARPLDDELHQLEHRADFQSRLREHQAHDRPGRDVQGRPDRHGPDAVAARRRRGEDDEGRAGQSRSIRAASSRSTATSAGAGTRRAPSRTSSPPGPTPARPRPTAATPRSPSRRCSSSRPSTCSGPRLPRATRT